MVNLWKKYDSKKTYDEYLNSDHKLRRQAVIISHILERHGIKKLNEIEKNMRKLLVEVFEPQLTEVSKKEAVEMLKPSDKVY